MTQFTASQLLKPQPTTWTLDKNLPNQVGLVPVQPKTSWSMAMGKVLGAHKGHLMSASENCIAREFGRHQLEYGRVPHGALGQFIQSRCGSVGAHVETYAMYDFPLKKPMTEAALFKVLGKQFTTALDRQVVASSAGLFSYGIWFGQQDDHVVLMVTQARRLVDVKPFSMVFNEEGKVRIQGKVFDPTSLVYGVINQGASGVAYCLTDPGVKLPNFDIECLGKRGDRVARVSLFASQGTGAGAKHLMSQTIWSDEVGETYKIGKFESLVAKLSKQNDKKPTPEHIVRIINAVRKTYQLPPLVFSALQTKALINALPKIMTSAPDEINKMIDTLCAGHNVPSKIIEGQFSMHASSQTRFSDLITLVLMSPAGRMRLLNSKSLITATAVQQSKTRAHLAVLTFTPLPQRTHVRLIEDVVGQINKVRRVKFLAGIKRLPKLDKVAQKASEQMIAGMDMDKVSRSFSANVAKSTGRHVQTIQMTLKDLTQIKSQKIFTSPKTRHVAVVVAPVKQKDHPWVVYRVIVVVPLKLVTPPEIKAK